MFPPQIEAAVTEQLYERPFYKTNVKFDVEVRQYDDHNLEFTTTASYDVVNRSNETRTWSAQYDYDVATSEVVECKINGAEFRVDNRDFHTMRGLVVPLTLAPRGQGSILFRVKERRRDSGILLYTSYNPATDFKLIFRSDLKDFEFDPIILYWWTVWPVREEGHIEVTFEKGLLPYQGVRIDFRRKDRHT